MGVKETFKQILGFGTDKFVLPVPNPEVRKELILLENIGRITVDWRNGGSRSIITVISKVELTDEDNEVINTNKLDLNRTGDATKKRMTSEEEVALVVRLKQEKKKNYEIAHITGIKEHSISNILTKARREGADLPKENKGGVRKKIVDKEKINEVSKM